MSHEAFPPHVRAEVRAFYERAGNAAHKRAGDALPDFDAVMAAARPETLSPPAQALARSIHERHIEWRAVTSANLPALMYAMAAEAEVER